MSRQIRLGVAVLSVLSLACAVQAATVTSSLEQVGRNGRKFGAIGNVDLTQNGEAIDWIKAGAGSLVGAEKTGASLLALSAVGFSAYSSYADDGYKLYWSTAATGSGSLADPLTYQGVRRNAALASNDIGFRILFTAPTAGDYTIKLFSAATDPVPFDLSVTEWVGGSLSGAALSNTLTGTRVSPVGDVDELNWTVNIVGATAGQSFATDIFHVNNTTSAILAFTGVTVVAVPEPTGAALVVMGLMSLASLRRSRRAV